MTEEKKLPRSKDPRFIKNPYTQRYVKVGGAKHRQMVFDGLMHNDADKNSIVASGTRTELETMRSKLLESGAIDLKNYRLSIRGGHLLKDRIKLPRQLVVEHCTKHITNSIVKNRTLMNSKLSDEQLTKLLTKICNAKIVGVDLDLSREYETLLKISESAESPNQVKTPDQKSVRFTDKPPRLLRPKGVKTRRRKFVVVPPPVFSDTTDGYTTMCDETSEYSETDYSCTD